MHVGTKYCYLYAVLSGKTRKCAISDGLQIYIPDWLFVSSVLSRRKRNSHFITLSPGRLSTTNVIVTDVRIRRPGHNKTAPSHFCWWRRAAFQPAAAAARRLVFGDGGGVVNFSKAACAARRHRLILLLILPPKCEEFTVTKSHVFICLTL